jgi:hypothetical protein
LHIHYTTVSKILKGYKKWFIKTWYLFFAKKQKIFCNVLNVLTQKRRVVILGSEGKTSSFPYTNETPDDNQLSGIGENWIA